MSGLVMPKFGLTMTEGLLSEWHVEVGTHFNAGDLLFTVETEKVANEVEAEAEGVLTEILVQAGETVPVGHVIARMAGAAGSVARSTPSEPAPIAQKDPLDSPSARKLMCENGLLSADVAGSGRDGRVMKEDVLRIIATPLARRIAEAGGIDLKDLSGVGPKGRIKADDVRAAAAQAPEPAPQAGASLVTEFEPDAVRLATARRVSAAKRDIPHFYVTHEAELSALTELRAQLNYNEGAAVRISVTHMLIRALGLALEEMPLMNRIWAGDKIIAFGQADIGIVAETSAGLRIPVIRNAGQVQLDEIAAQAKTLTTRARDGDLKPSDVGHSVISISNVGMFGMTTLTPIISPPNSMILGVGADRQVFRPDANSAPTLRRELTLTLACDHRIIDGADAARFLSAVVDILETPVRLLRPARKLA